MIPSPAPSPLARPATPWFAAVLLSLACAATPAGSQAGSVYVPNASFESPVAPQFGPDLDAWVKTPQPGTFDPNLFGPWADLTGAFVNYPGTPYWIDNSPGGQLAFCFNYPQAGFGQDLAATFQPNSIYTLTVGLTTSIAEPLPQGAQLLLSLYYRDAAGNAVTVAATTVTFDTNVFANVTHLLDYQVTLTNVNPTDAWAGKPIGIQISSIVDPAHLGGVWDVDNVRLTQAVNVPNFSFESPVAPQFGPDLDAWVKTPQPGYFDPSVFGPWSNLTGEFVNYPGTPYTIPNAPGSQLGFLFSFPGTGLTQDLPAQYQPNTAYTLTVGLTSSTVEPLATGAPLLVALYYRDAQSNLVYTASTNVTFDPAVFTNLLQTRDFSCTLAGAGPGGAPWVGRPIGIEFLSTANPNQIGGVWDLDNVRLTTAVAPSLLNPGIVAGHFQATIQGELGASFQILSSPDLSLPLALWTPLGIVVNTTGTTTFTDPGTVGARQFYTLRQLPPVFAVGGGGGGLGGR